MENEPAPASLAVPADIARTVIAILARMVEGESLRAIVKSNGGPSYVTFFRWLHEYPELEKLYFIAQEQRAETHVDEILEIADDARNDWMERNDPENPGWVANHEHINRSRLRVDTRKWIAAKMKPKRYGDSENRSAVAVQVNVITGVPEPSTPST